MATALDLTTLGLSEEARSTRADYIGGSDANTIMSGNEPRLLRLWREKRGEVEPEDLSDNLAVQMGSFTEPLNVAWFEKQTGMSVGRQGRVVHPTIKYMRATLDGECGFDGPDAVFEAKHCGVRNTDAELFARYVPQLTHNALCAGRSRAFLSCFKGNGDWMVMEYALDDAYAERLIEAERGFWECVKSGEPPCPVPPEPTPKPVGVIEYDMTGSNSWSTFAAEYLETILPAQRHESAKKELKLLVPEDASKCTGHGITITRTKAGALRFAV
jgi:predicted phage-related endonuclease